MKMETYTSVNGHKTKNRGKDLWSTKMVRNLMESGKITKNKEKGFTLGLMVQKLKEYSMITTLSAPQ
jgi:hypothetical protein